MIMLMTIIVMKIRIVMMMDLLGNIFKLVLNRGKKIKIIRSVALTENSLGYWQIINAYEKKFWLISK